MGAPGQTPGVNARTLVEFAVSGRKWFHGAEPLAAIPGEPYSMYGWSEGGAFEDPDGWVSETDGPQPRWRAFLRGAVELPCPGGPQVVGWPSIEDAQRAVELAVSLGSRNMGEAVRRPLRR